MSVKAESDNQGQFRPSLLERNCPWLLDERSDRVKAPLLRGSAVSGDGIGSARSHIT